MENNWSPFKKIGFLFLLFYFFLYINSSQFLLTFLIEPIWQKVIPWFANLVGYERPISVFTNGSGDTTYNYYQIYFFAVVSGILAVVVGLIDSKRKNYQTLFNWLTLLIRYYLAAQMISYGLAKLYYMQFSFPSAMRLDQPMGDFSPMGLLWTFMGYSKGYTMFTGALEFIGGVLLLSRYTTTLGALTTFGVMLNVMMLNYCYDVPVKILSTHMVVMAMFLIALDWRRLLSFFVTNQKVEPNMLAGVVPEKYEKAKTIIKWLLLVGYFGYSFYQMNEMGKQYGPNAPKPFFKGKYRVEKITQTPTNDSILVSKDLLDWKFFYQSWEGYATAKTTDDDKTHYVFEPDTTNQLFRIKRRGYPDFQELKYESLDSMRFHIYGNYRTDSVDIIMRKVPIESHLLVKRKFHWISEYPFNR